MDDRTMRSLLGTPEQPELVFRRAYRVSHEELRDACTSADRLARWFGVVQPMPHGVGDSFTAALSEDPQDLATGSVVRCDEDAVVVRWSWQDERESTISLRFLPIDEDTTELVLRHALVEPEHAAGYGGGWEQMLQALARALGTTPEDDGPCDQELERGAVQAWRTMTRHPLEVQRRVDAPLDLVWRAFTTVDGLRSWWWRHWNDVQIELDPRPGGRYRFVVPSQGIELTGRFIAVEKASRLSYTWQWSDEDGVTEDEAVDIRLGADGDATVVTVRHTGPWGDDSAATSYRQGWEFVLGELAAVVPRQPDEATD